MKQLLASAALVLAIGTFTSGCGGSQDASSEASCAIASQLMTVRGDGSQNKIWRCWGAGLNHSTNTSTGIVLASDMSACMVNYNSSGTVTSYSCDYGWTQPACNAVQIKDTLGAGYQYDLTGISALSQGASMNVTIATSGSPTTQRECVAENF